MKFNDGFWLLKHGVKPYYALQVVNDKERSNGIELHVSTKPIRHRGDTLGGPLLTINVHSVLEQFLQFVFFYHYRLINRIFSLQRT